MKSLLILPIVALLSGCLIETNNHQKYRGEMPIFSVAEIPGAYVEDRSSRGDWILYDVYDANFKATLKSVNHLPDYYEFYMWRPGFRALCGESKSPHCTADATQLRGNTGAEDYLRNSWDTFYAEPVGRPRRCSTHLEDYVTPDDDVRLCAGTYTTNGEEVTLWGDLYIDPGVVLDNVKIAASAIYVSGGAKLHDSWLMFSSSQGVLHGIELSNSVLATGWRMGSIDLIDSDSGSRNNISVKNLVLRDDSLVAIGVEGHIQYKNIRLLPSSGTCATFDAYAYGYEVHGNAVNEFKLNIDPKVSGSWGGDNMHIRADRCP
jgi:hypothetical protein